MTEASTHELPSDLTRSAESTSGNDQRSAISNAYQKTRETVESIAWIMGSMAVIHYSDLFRVLLYSDFVDRKWLAIAYALFGVTAAIAIYLIIYLSWIRGVPYSHWEQEVPLAIPVATAAYSLSSLCFNVALWSVWSYLTPFILITIFMGFVSIVSLTPALEGGHKLRRRTDDKED